MNAFQDRCTHLINVINALIDEVKNDYFIPQMLVHKKSAEFIPERISELFQELLDEEYQDFLDHVTKSIKELYDELRSNKIILDQDKFSNARAINRAKLYNKNIKMEFDSNNQKLIKLKQISKINLDEYENRIGRIDSVILDIKRLSSKLRNNIQKMQSICISERNLYEDNFNSQIFELRQAFKKAVDQVNSYANDYQIVQTVSKHKLKKLIQQYQIQNDAITDSIDQILQMFDGNSLRSEDEIQDQLSQYIQNIHKPLFINEKRIRNDSIEKSIEKYIKRMDDEIQTTRLKIHEREMKLTQKYESVHVKKNISPRNLRAIYASRQKRAFTKPNANEFDFRND